MFLEISQNSQENTCVRASFLIKLQAFSCEFCEISKNTVFTEHVWTTASGENIFHGSYRINRIQDHSLKTS